MTEDTNEASGELRVALLSDDPSFRSMVRASIESSLPDARLVCDADVPVSGLTRESVDKLLSYRPELLFVDFGERTGLGTRFVSALTDRAQMAVVAAGAPVEADELLAVIRAGAMEYLPRPVDGEDVTAACARIGRRLDRGTSGGGTRRGRVFTVFSPKGGTGVTTTAVNLAVRIRSATGKETLLLDLSDGLGSASVFLGMEPRYSYLDAVESLHRMDERLLDSFLEEHETGLRLLGAPLDVERGRAVTPEQVVQLLRLVRRHHGYTVVDLGRGMDDVARATIQASDERLLLATPDLPTLRNVKRTLADVASPEGESRESPAGAEAPHGGVRLIVNRHDEAGGLSRKEIEKAIGLPIFHSFPWDDGPVLRSGNLGRPVVGDTTCAFSTAVKGLGNRLAADDLPESNGRRPLGRFIQAVLHPFSSDTSTRPETTSRRRTSTESKTEGATR